ncbi:hypothetical protein D3C76_1278880 [compost metagenome]
MLERIYRGHIITQRVALDQVAVIEQQAVLGLKTGFFDQRGCFGKAVLICRLVCKIIVVHHVHVQIGGLHNPQIHRSGSVLGSRGKHGGQGQQTGRNRCRKDFFPS